MSGAVVRELDEIDAVALTAQIDRVEASATFRNSPVLRRMFRHIAERGLARDTHSLKGYTLSASISGNADRISTRASI